MWRVLHVLVMAKKNIDTKWKKKAFLLIVETHTHHPIFTSKPQK